MATEARDINEETVAKLMADAAHVRLHGGSPDWVVMSAIGMGFGTRKELKETIGFGYDIIEKVLERNAGDLRSQQDGPIERFVLASAKVERVEERPKIILPKPPKEEPVGYVEDLVAQEQAMTAESKNEPKISARAPGNGHLADSLSPKPSKATAPKVLETHELELKVEKPGKIMPEIIPTEMCWCGRENRHRGHHRGQAPNRKSETGQDVVKKQTKKRAKVAQSKPAQVVTPDKNQDILVTEKRQLTPHELLDQFNGLEDVDFENFFNLMNDGQDAHIVWGVLPDEPRLPKVFYQIGYRMLTTMLDPYMLDEETKAVWTLIQYLNKQERTR